MFACVAISPSFKLLCFTILKETGLLVYLSTCLLVYLSTCLLVYLSTRLLVYLYK